MPSPSPLRERLTAVWLRIASLWRRRRLDRDLDDELAFHLAMREQAHQDAGLDDAAARAAAQRQFGSPLRVKESLRDLWGRNFFDRGWQDLRFALRAARRQPAFTLVVILTLALGIGATTAIFTIVDAVLLRPFPFAQADRLVMVWETNRARNIHTFTGSALNYRSWQQEATTFEALGAWSLRHDNRSDGPRPERVQGAVASAAFFEALRLDPALGRFFRTGEDAPGQPLIVVLGHEYWHRAFEGNPTVLGRSLVINGQAWTIVGVAPPLRAPFRADVWRPLVTPADGDRGDHDVQVVGRLKDGVAMRHAEAELQTIAARLEATYPDTNTGWSARVESLFDGVITAPTRRALLVLLGAVALLLAIACVNVTNLLLARSIGRQREMATRLALGAARTRLVRQLLTESGLLACAGALAGLMVAAWTLRGIQLFFPVDVPGLESAELNGAAFAFAAAIAMLTTIVIGLAPALQWSRVSFQAGLKQSTRGATDAPPARRLRHTLVVAEIALALVLLIGAGLLLRSFDRLQQVPLGFSPDQVLTAKIGLHGDKYDPMPAYVGFLDRLLLDLKNRPGVAAVGVSSSVPFGGGYTGMQTRREADRHAATSQATFAGWRVVGGDYFRAMGIPLRTGRLFRDGDDSRLPRVAIISEALARRLWPGEDPIGRRMLVGDSLRPYEIIGVAGPARLTSLADDPEPVMYFHYRQFGWPTMTIALRATGDPSGLVNAVRRAVATIDPEQPVFDVTTLRDYVDRAADAPRMNAALLAIFAALALALSAIGVYGVMSYAAAQRTGEIGIRLALGAEPGDIRALIWRHGLLLVTLGLTIGLAITLPAGRALQSLLYEVSPNDATTYAAVLAVMTTVAVLACYLPAHRAARIDPLSALRRE